MIPTVVLPNYETDEEKKKYFRDLGFKDEKNFQEVKEFNTFQGYPEPKIKNKFGMSPSD